MTGALVDVQVPVIDSRGGGKEDFKSRIQLHKGTFGYMYACGVLSCVKRKDEKKERSQPRTS